MKGNEAKVKLLIFVALLAIVLLIGLSVFQIINIHSTRETLNKQQQEIELLKQKINYYENQNQNNNGSIVVGEDLWL